MADSPLKIRTYGDPVLRAVARPVEKITPELQQLARDMLQAMYAADGVGLAAPQIGKSIRLVVIDVAREESERNPIVFFNPEVFPDDESDLAIAEEGCLSVPDVWAEVARPDRVTVKALDIDGQPFEMTVEGHLARAVQHEADHLDGRLFVDRISPTDRAMLQSKLKKMARGRK
ncbi:MAG: peptide deformylase [Fibrobacterales bacterium]|nr:peptide deformylase [Fibrobacterales bacterium]MBP5188228.1 peptide deformylase [Fibrobacterales bacterium]MBP5351499.1 peptide deformylase [Fibrobacterales bacterium]